MRNTLRLQRFCGREVYEVKAADVFLDLPKADEEGILLNLKFDAGSLIECTTPDNERGDAPSVEVNLPIPSVAGDELVGKTIRVKRSSNEERGTWNRIYVFEHEDLRDIAATFVEVTENECRLSLTGRTQDPNHYDGSKAETIVKLESWFPLKELNEVARALAQKAVSTKPAAEEALLPQANLASKNLGAEDAAEKPAPPSKQAAPKKPPNKKPAPPSKQAAPKKPPNKKP
ncbi:MAG TPA: hypothetical protein VFU02_00900, partial [Polyangiaceae bacterium]|nr:hypothetical protein [Polyangiaceae bacterium]